MSEPVSNAGLPDRWRRFFADLCAARRAELIELGGSAAPLDLPEPTEPAEPAAPSEPVAPPELWPAHTLILASDPALLPVRDDRVIALVPLAKGAAAPRIALAVDGGAPSAAVDEVLADIAAASQRESPTEPVPTEVGRLIHVLARTGDRRRVLDVGAGVGASTLWLGSAMALTGGQVLAAERDSARAIQARKHIRRAGLDPVVDLRVTELGRVAWKIERPLDLIFLDEAAEDRVDDFLALVDHCAPGALVISHAGTAGTAALSQLNALLQLHPRVRAVLRLPVGSGVTVAVLT